MRFKVSINDVYVHVRSASNQQWLVCEFNMDQQEFEKKISDWPLEWRIPVMKEEFQEEEQDREIQKEVEEIRDDSE